MRKFVVLLWVCLYWLLRCIAVTAKWAWRDACADLAPYVGTITLFKAVAALCLGVTGIGMLGVFLAVIR